MSDGVAISTERFIWDLSNCRGNVIYSSLAPSTYSYRSYGNGNVDRLYYTWVPCKVIEEGRGVCNNT